MILFQRFFTTFKCTNHLYCITGSSSSNHVNNVRPYMETGLRKALLQVSLFCLSPPPQAALCCGQAGEKEKESARGMMERGKRGRKRGSRLFPLPMVPRALSIFSIIDIFIGMPCGSICGGGSCFAMNLVRGREPGFHIAH